MNTFISSVYNSPTTLSPTGTLDVDLSCDHGVGFDKLNPSVVNDPYPEMLSETFPVVEAIYHAARNGETMNGEIPLPNLYYNPSTPLPLPPHLSSKYAIVAAIGMLIGNSNGYDFVSSRRQTLLNELTTSAVQSIVFSNIGEEGEGGMWGWFHMAIAVRFIYEDVYWRDDRVVSSPNLEVSKAFLFNDVDLMERLMNKYLPNYDGTSGYVMSYLRSKVNCKCMDHKVTLPSPKFARGGTCKAIEGGKDSTSRHKCGNCGKEDGEGGIKLKLCCGSFYVCDKVCQRKSWTVHKKVCRKVKVKTK